MIEKILYGQRGRQWDIAPKNIKPRAGVTRNQRYTRLPVLIVLTSVAGLLFIGAGVYAWKVGSLLRLATASLEISDAATLLFLAGTGLTFPVALLLTFRALDMEYRIHIVRDGVSYTASSRGQIMNQWTEPLANYRGVLAEKASHTRLLIGPSEPYAKLLLLHDVPEKTVLLACEDGWPDEFENLATGGIRLVVESYARALKRPALERDMQGALLSREPADLDEPLGNGLDAKDLAQNWQLDAPPPELHVEEKRNSLYVTTELKRAGIKGHLIAAAIGVAIAPIAVLLILGPFLIMIAIESVLPTVSRFIAWNLSLICMAAFFSALYIAWERARATHPYLERLSAPVRNFMFALGLETKDKDPKTSAYGPLRFVITPHSISIERTQPDGAVLKTRAKFEPYEEILITAGPYVCGLTLVGDDDTYWVRTPSKAAAEWLRGAILFMASTVNQDA